MKIVTLATAVLLLTFSVGSRADCAPDPYKPEVQPKPRISGFKWGREHPRPRVADRMDSIFYRPPTRAPHSDWMPGDRRMRHSLGRSSDLTPNEKREVR